MKPLLLILLLIPFACFGQNNKKDTCCNCAYENEVSDLGIGLVDGAGIADIFNDSLLKHKAEHVESESSKFNGTKFCPKFFKPGYSIMLYVCLAKTANSYKVLVNESTIKYLPRSYKFISWESYLTGSYGINEEPDQPQPLRKEPNEKADSIIAAKKMHDFFCPLLVKGDWIKVQFDCHPDDQAYGPCKNYIARCKEPIIGWLRWKKGSKLLIQIATME